MKELVEDKRWRMGEWLLSCLPFVPEVEEGENILGLIRVDLNEAVLSSPSLPDLDVPVSTKTRFRIKPAKSSTSVLLNLQVSCLLLIPSPESQS